MQRKFLANLMLLLFLNLLVKPLYIFGVDLGVQNLVGPDEYGIFFSMFNFSMLFNILLDAGITNYNNRNISQYRHLLNKHFSGIFTLRLMLAVLYVLVAFGTGLLAGYSQRQMQLLGFLAFNQFVISFILYLRSNIAGLQLFKTDSLISVLDRLILIVLCGYLIYSQHTRSHFTVEWFAICQTVAYLVTFSVALVVVMRKAAFRRFYWNPTFARMILRNSYPYALLALLMMFYFRIDSVLLERLLPAGTGSLQAGIYASAFRLLDAFLMVPYLFSVLLLPMFARMIRFKENPGLIISIAFPIILLFAVGTVALSLGFSREIMGLLYNDHVEESARVYAMLVPGLVAFSASYIFGTLLTANGNLRILNLIAGAGMVLNILLNILLIPQYQASGSAFASLVTLMLSAVLQILISVRKFALYPSGSQWRRSLLFLAGVCAIMWLQHFLPWEWYLRMGMAAMAILILAFSIRFIQPVQLYRILLRTER